jgi:hypothetical protein
MRKERIGNYKQLYTMRNRNLMQKKVETIESILINLQRIVNTQEPVEVYRNNIEKGLEIIEDVKSMIEAEPLSPNEVNKF